MEVVEKVFTYISPDTKSKIQKFGQETYSTFKWILAELKYQHLVSDHNIIYISRITYQKPSDSQLSMKVAISKYS